MIVERIVRKWATQKGVRAKPKMSASTVSDKKNLVLFATKSEMREVCENPSSVMHYVLLCKDEAPKTNTSHNLPLVLSSLLQEFKDVFPDELSPGYLHYEALNTKST